MIMKNIFGLGGSSSNSIPKDIKATPSTEATEDSSAENICMKNANGEVSIDHTVSDAGTSPTTTNSSAVEDSNNAHNLDAAAPTSAVECNVVSACPLEEGEISNTSRTDVNSEVYDNDKTEQIANVPVESEESKTSESRDERDAKKGNSSQESSSAKKLKQQLTASPKRGPKEEKKRKGDSSNNAAGRIFSNTLQKTRTREEIDLENRKLRSDLSAMRKRLNVALDSLASAKSAMNRLCATEGLSADMKDFWSSTLAKLDLNKDVVGSEDTSNNSVTEANQKVSSADGIRVNRQRKNRRTQWKERTREFNQLNDSAVAGIIYDPLHLNPKPSEMAEGKKQNQRKMNPHSVSLEDTTLLHQGRGRMSDMMHVRANPKRKITGGAGGQQGMPNQQQQKSGKRKGRDAKAAAQNVVAEAIRQELRIAVNPDDMAKAIEKALKNGMKYEAELGAKKLDKLKQSGCYKTEEPKIIAIASSGDSDNAAGTGPPVVEKPSVSA